ncbi:MAG TPA: transglutaminase [Arcobacter sp.]|nr:transglutaminase [Arcobacter sp.]
MYKYIFLILITLAQSSLGISNFSDETISNIKNTYGPKSLKRLASWDNMITKAKKAKTVKKLKYVNDYFNNIKYIRDIKHWNQNDYWATPLEFFGTAGGDCEDYAIAKYFTLLKVGIPEEKLRIAYVKLLKKKTKYEEAHMVLTYYHKVNATPIVLDNVNKRLKLASKRKDLKLIYSFNANGLYKAKNKGRSKKVGSNKLIKWKTLINKI